MTNEFGALLDRAGYAPSIMQTIRPGRGCCYLCGRPAGGEKMDRHEPWGGANRQKSKALGLWVELHHFGCHEGPNGNHISGDAARRLRADAQRAAMLRYGWDREAWIARFGKSELSEAEAAGEGPLSHGFAVTAPPKGEPRPLRGGGAAADLERAGRFIRAFWPDHPTTFRETGFQVIDWPDLPY